MTSSESLDAFLSRVRVRIDEALERYLPRPPACPALISEAMRYSVMAGGKRLRPSLTWPRRRRRAAPRARDAR